MGLCGFSPLVNSIFGADNARLSNFVKSGKSQEKFKKEFIKRKFPNGLLVFPPGVLLICKVLMIKSVPDTSHPYFNPEISSSELFNKFPINPQDFGDDVTVYRVVEGDPKHKLWYFMDNNLVLPEYLVEFDYILRSTT